MTLKIRNGGIIRWSFDVDTASADWVDGQIVEIKVTDGLATRGTGATTRVSGMAIEPKQSAFSGDREGSGLTSDLTEASGKVSLLMSEAIVDTDAIESGISFSTGELVYSNNSGLLTDSNSNNKVYGQVLPSQDVESGFVRLHASIQL